MHPESNRDAAAVGGRIGADPRRWLSTPEGKAQLAELLAPALPHVLECASALAERIARNLLPLRRWAAQYDGPATPGYEAFLVEQGYDVIRAKLMAKALTEFGASFAEEWNRVRKPIGTAFRRILRAAGKGPLVLSRRAKELQALLKDGASHALIETALAKASLSQNLQDFCGLVDRAGNRDRQACEELGELAQSMLPYLPDPRGRRMSRETAIHVLLLEELGELGKPHGYTWSPEEEDFVDAATRATRVSLGNSDFDPRAAHRLLRSGAI